MANEIDSERILANQSNEETDAKPFLSPQLFRPVAPSSRDMVGIAHTECGKTFAVSLIYASVQKSGNRSDPPPVILPVGVDSDTYNMNHKNRGMCLIFNNKEFDPHTQLNVRRGTDADACSLYNCFRDLDFNVTIYHNATKTEILATLKNAAADDHSKNDCFACVILSHGDDGVIYGRDGKFRTDLIFEPFLGEACISLAGKPKLFFIQACQGDRLDAGIPLRTSHDGNEMVKIPSQADILVAYSTVPGFFSWRNTTRGSWFIQSLCHVLKNHGKTKELVEMLTMVNRRVAYDYESCTPDNPSMHQMKQISYFTSRLTRKVYFPSK